MWKTHFWNLIYHSQENTLALGGSTLAGIVVVGIIGVIFGFIITAFIEWYRSGWDVNSLKESLKTWPPYVGAIGGLSCAWVLLFAWSVCVTVYKDHQGLVLANSKLRAQCLAMKAPLVTIPKALAQKPKDIGASRLQISQNGKKNIANPGIVQAPINQGCGVNQIGGSGNQASVNCAPQQRVLTDEQIKKIKVILDANPGFEYGLRHTDGNLECQKYADQFAAVLDSKHWTQHQTQFLIPEKEAYGLWILVPDMQHAPQGAAVLQQALGNAGIQALGVSVPFLKEGTVDLMVGPEESTKPK